MQAAKEYDLQFNNILKKEEYKKYVATLAICAVNNLKTPLAYRTQE
jgi:hypothetical protein